MRCSEYQRYQLLRAIHNYLFRQRCPQYVVPNIKDINFWEQFTTINQIGLWQWLLFRISKISTFESNSQLVVIYIVTGISCSEYQRYQLLRAIHNPATAYNHNLEVVPNIKDINFWEQFTTASILFGSAFLLFRISKISTFESNSQLTVQEIMIDKVVPNIKDINFWEQFTTNRTITITANPLFRISKISTFESNSQLNSMDKFIGKGCSEYQRYQLLRAIHNEIRKGTTTWCVVPNIKDINFWEQFTTRGRMSGGYTGCSEYQRYQLLRAIHNIDYLYQHQQEVVPNIKDINFWEQFTTNRRWLLIDIELFRISKISTFESNSQRHFSHGSG